MRPEGMLKIIGAEHDRPSHHLAVYAKVICEDEDGKLWYFQAAAFNFDMKPFPAPKDSINEHHA